MTDSACITDMCISKGYNNIGLSHLYEYMKAQV